MNFFTDQDIKCRAYFIWQETGREDAVANWYQAHEECRQLVRVNRSQHQCVIDKDTVDTNTSLSSCFCSEEEAACSPDTSSPDASSSPDTSSSPDASSSSDTSSSPDVSSTNPGFLTKIVNSYYYDSEKDHEKDQDKDDAFHDGF